MKGRPITLMLWLVLQTSALWAQTPVGNPLPDVEVGDLEMRLVDWAQVPKTSNSKPWARINMLREVPDGSRRMAVNDLNGPFYLIEAEDSSQVHEYLDFRDIFNKFFSTSGKGSGFGAFAFHPEFAENGIFYTTHGESSGAGNADYSPLQQNGIAMQWVLTRWVAEDPSANVFKGTHKEMVRWDFNTVIHGAQEISFNPYAEKGGDDYGMLYVCLGEGGSSGKGLHQNCQTISSYLGTIWRIDPEGDNAPNGKYGIPADNPYVGETAAVEEIWAYGFRNPHRIHFDQRNGETILFAGDIGEHNIEEVNLIEKGGNYGWNDREGTFYFNKNGNHSTVYTLPTNDDPDLIYPVAQYDHDDGVAINLGHVWHSDLVPEFKGIFLMGDILTGRAFYVPVDSLIQGRQYPLKELQTFYGPNRSMTIEEITEVDGASPRVDLKFGYDSSGEVYIVTKADGRIRKLRKLLDEVLSDEKDLISFSLSAQTGAATIVEGNHTVTIEVFYGTILSQLVPVFEVSELAKVYVDGVEQTSGQSKIDFSNGSVTYKIVAEDGSAQEWKVFVKTAERVLNTVDDAWVAIQPTVVEDMLQIQLNKTQAQLFVMDLQGKILKSEKLTQGTNQLDLNQLAAGMYLVKIKDGNTEWQSKVIKK